MTKEKLMQYRSIKTEIKQLQEKIQELEERKTSIKSQIITDMPTGGESLDLLTIITIIEETQEKLRNKEIELLKVMNEIEEIIDSLENSEDRCILRARYIECKKWEEICVELNYSWRHMHRLHSKILDKIA